MTEASVAKLSLIEAIPAPRPAPSQYGLKPR
jgi:hypothetical protein